MKTKFLLFVCLSGSLAFAQHASINARNAQADQSRAMAGQRIFEENCMRCHAADGSGNTFVGHKWKIPDLRSESVQRLTPEQLIQIISDGKNDRMPSHKDKLSPAEIRQAEEYLRELARKQPLQGSESQLRP